MRPALALLVFAACGPSPSPSRPPVPPTPDFPLAEDAARGAKDAHLAALLRDHWDHTMRSSPVWATTQGDHRFDDRLADPSHAEVESRREKSRAFLVRARSLELDDPTDDLNRQLLVERLASSLASSVCESHLWSVSIRANPITSTGSLRERHTVKSDGDAKKLLARYRQIAGTVDAAIANIHLGAKRGMFANAKTVERVIDMIDRQLAQPIDEWALLKPLSAEAMASVSAAFAPRFAVDLRAVVDKEIKPAFVRYRAALANDILPNARRGDRVGVGALPEGAPCYAAQIRRYLGIARTAEELHELGQREIARINEEMRALGEKLFGTRDLAEVVDRLRTDPELYFEDADQILAAARDALAAARAAVPAYFGLRPKADCVVVPIPDYQAPYTTIAYYQAPHADGSKPGEYFINTYKPEIRPRFEMKVLAFHESIPGHHFQIAISHEQTAMPAFRRFGGSTAFIEGWALYTERLAGEMGLYETDLDRMGMLSYDAWRASRLVVDTGIHAKGWTREQAEQFLSEHTALTEANIRNEVDRYISWPGQALAYKVGQLEIVRLREDARAALGAAFDIRGFHDAVLASGAVTLPVLAANVALWVETVKAR